MDYTPHDWFTQRNVKVTRKGGGLKTTCPACNSRSALVVQNDIGTWACGSCSRRGNFFDLRKLYGDASVVVTSSSLSKQFEVFAPDYAPIAYHRDYTRALHGDPGKSQLKYLRGLGAKPEIIKQLRIGYSDEFDALVFPYLYKRALTSCSYLRFLRTPGDWWKVDGSPRTSSWFGQQLFNGSIDEATIVKDPLDAMVLMSMGVPNVLAPYNDEDVVRYRSHHLAMLQKTSTVYVIAEPTDECERWAHSTREQVGKWRCKVVQTNMLTKDLIREDAEVLFNEAKEKATCAFGMRTRTALSWVEQLDHEYDGGGRKLGYPTKSEPLDELLGGWRPGEVSLIAGDAGVGKSTFAAFLSLLQASEGIPVLFMSFEVAPTAMVRKWITMLAGNPIEQLERHEYVVARKKLSSRPLYLSDTYGLVELSDVRRCVYDTCTRHGTKLVVIDHLSHMTSMNGAASNHASSRVDPLLAHGNVLREAKRWAMDLGIHVVILAHLRKRQAGQRGQSSIQDVRGSSEIYQTADNAILLERDKGGSDLVCRLVKVRDDRGSEGTIHFSFNPGSLVYMP